MPILSGIRRAYLCLLDALCAAASVAPEKDSLHDLQRCERILRVSPPLSGTCFTETAAAAGDLRHVNKSRFSSVIALVAEHDLGQSKSP